MTNQTKEDLKTILEIAEQRLYELERETSDIAEHALWVTLQDKVVSALA